MKRGLALVCLVAAVVAGCSTAGAEAAGTTDAPTPAGHSWPDDWQTDVCGAMDHVSTAVSELGDAYSDAQSFDLDSANANATKASGDAKTAGEYLADAPTFAPGASMVVYLNGSAAAIRKAANLLKIGLAQTDASAVKAANAQLEVSTAQLKRATTAASALQAKTGFSCAAE